LGSIIRTILHQKIDLRTINPYDNRCGGYIVSIGPKNSGTLRLYRIVKDIAKSRIVIASFCCIGLDPGKNRLPAKVKAASKIAWERSAG
jgi:hypothetical protein